MKKRLLMVGLLSLGLAAGFLAVTPAKPVAAADPAKEAELDRVNLIKKIRPAVVAVYIKDFSRDPRGSIAGGGSGVIIDKEGYCLTNFHVVDHGGQITPTFACGMPNGELYDAVTVGVDRGGDTAMIKLIPKKEGDTFPVAELGDSDTLKPGDWTMIMGNAQLLSTDFTPSVSFGLVSGVNRYVDFGFAEHTDAIQYDTTANQGNSGGPIFNMKGQVVGLVFGGAPGKRGAFNTGIGYGLPINMAKNFLGHMRGGLFSDHATLGATVSSQASEESDVVKMTVNQVLEDSDVGRRGIIEGDELLNFAGRPLTSVNQFKSALGIFPKEWRLPLTYRRGNEKKDTLVRLMSLTPAVVKKKDAPPGGPGGGAPPKPRAFGAGAKFWEEKKGFTNYYFNRQVRDALLADAKKLGDYSPLTGEWVWTGTYDRDMRGGDFLVKIEDVKDPANPKDTTPEVTLALGAATYKLNPLKQGLTVVELSEPPFSGGLMMAAYQYRRFLTLGAKGSEREACHFAGVEPVYLMPADGSKPKKYEDVRVFAEVIRTEHADVPAKWYYYKAALNPQHKDKPLYPDGTLFAAEVTVSRDQDPCELYFSDFKNVGGRELPHRIEVRNGDKRYAMFNVKVTTLK
ncbi:S1C family serine protease [Zavarzinella formosa]|uniref:S1C family serine protease n=1 Tax=Zavarzinella formosa TaxID=360055 RepID=UPI0002F1BDF9|nr:S1C family serine protease [Zavarzinella formosa]